MTNSGLNAADSIGASDNTTPGALATPFNENATNFKKSP